MDIKCRKTSCKFNNSYSCEARGVCITRDTECGSFEPDNSKPAVDFSKNMFEADMEYSNSRHICNVNLECNSCDCLFNENKKCMANGITVIDEGQGQTACGTFIKR